MKKLVFLSLFLLSSVFVFAEDPAAVAPATDAVQAAVTPAPAVEQAVPTQVPEVTTTVAAPAPESYTFESAHYAVRSYVSAANAQAVAERLEAYQTAYNQYFHFDVEKLGLKLKVRIFATKARYDQYLQRLINETREDFVYLHYTDAARSELVGFADPNFTVPDASIAHQGFIQFLRTFQPNPPLWIREGFAVFFEELGYDEATKTASVRENLSWLETLKDLMFGARNNEALSMDAILGLSVDQAREKIQVFYPQAWALVNYLAKSDNKNHNRILWDSIAQLNPSATLEENSKAVVAKAFKWEAIANLQSGFQSYFKEKKTYRELIQAGIDLYANGKAKDAEASFATALGLQDASYVPYYYLGLISYDKSSYAQAETFYLKALEKGASPALTNYAMGVNAFADNRYDAASQFLQKTTELDPTFKDKVNELLQRMES